jgi:hypothetical protein
MEVVQNYLLRYDGCHALFLRKSLTDLEKSSILDFKEFIPEDLYTWNGSKYFAEFKHNGSRLQFGYMANQNEADLQQYLSARYVVIVIDECSQISPEGYQFMRSRNQVNRECKPDHRDQFPTPIMLLCTNPVGPFWGYYRDVFVKKKPWNIEPEAKRSHDGSFWTLNAGKAVCVYNPFDYDYVHSTVLDNPIHLARDLGLIRRLEAMPKDKRDRYLYGEMDALSGQYYDCWDQGVHVLRQEEIESSVIWQPWQPRWLGWDWGRVHFGAAVWMTLALVKQPSGDYKQKIVVYREYVDKGKDYRALANTISSLTRMGLPGATDDVQKQSGTLDTIYFSHEKFALQMERQSPAMVMSGYLTGLGLPAARQGTRDRVGRATLLYDALKTCGLVVLDTCPQVIDAIPQLIRNEKNIEDVLKQETKADDVYDGFSLGLFGQLAGKDLESKEQVALRERLKAIDDPFIRHLQQLKATLDRDRVVAEDSRPDWLSSLDEDNRPDWLREARS